MKRIALFTISCLIYLTSTLNAHAQIGLSRSQQGNRGFKITGSGPDLQNLISNTITIFFTIGGIGFMVMLFWGAVSWILSGGDKEKIAGARKRITTAIIGVVLLSFAYLIMNIIGYVFNISFLQTGTATIPSLLQP